MADAPFFLVWNEDGFPPRCKHPTCEQAENEAERLANAHPGKQFCVLVPVSRFSVRRVNVERFDLDTQIPF
jgi:hypothetical protein